MNHPDTIINSDWFNKYVNVPQPAYISVDNRQTCNYMPNIFIQVEPNIIINNEDYLIDNCKRYHTIFTFNKNVLEKCKNALLKVKNGEAAYERDSVLFNQIQYIIKENERELFED